MEAFVFFKTKTVASAVNMLFFTRNYITGFRRKMCVTAGHTIRTTLLKKLCLCNAKLYFFENEDIACA